MKILHLDSSVLGENSASKALTAKVAAAWNHANPSAVIRHRDLGAQAPQHLSPDYFAIGATPEGERTESQASELKLSDALIEEFLAADALIIGAPLYNFTIPSGLKAWIDRVAVAGKTFKYSAQGPIGLAGDKKVVIVATSGGKYADTPVDAAHVGHLKTVLNFLGVKDIAVVRAAGLGLSAESRAEAVAAAEAEIATLFAGEKATVAA
ncbi:MAG TPA: NAD(P)H-dependent oxidoreductase [Reyranella sp.]|nr:NAD(P)H-dependent oxidoreductase [Reyranella sp.]